MKQTPQELEGDTRKRSLSTQAPRTAGGRTGTPEPRHRRLWLFSCETASWVSQAIAPQSSEALGIETALPALGLPLQELPSEVRTDPNPGEGVSNQTHEQGTGGSHRTPSTRPHNRVEARRPRGTRPTRTCGWRLPARTAVCESGRPQLGTHSPLPGAIRPLLPPTELQGPLESLPATQRPTREHSGKTAIYRIPPIYGLRKNEHSLPLRNM